MNKYFRLMMAICLFGFLWIISLVIVSGVRLPESANPPSFPAASVPREREYAQPPVDQIVILLVKGFTKDVAAEIAASITGEIKYSSSPNGRYYVLKVPTRSREQLYQLIERIKNDPRISRVTTGPYVTSPDPAKVINDSGTQYPVNQVLITLSETSGSDIANNVAASVAGLIVGFTPSINLYTIEVPTKSKKDLERLIESLRKDSRIEGVSKNILLKL